MMSVVAALPVKVLPVLTMRPSVRMRLSLVGVIFVVILSFPVLARSRDNLTEFPPIFQTMMCCTRLQYKGKVENTIRPSLRGGNAGAAIHPTVFPFYRRMGCFVTLFLAMTTHPA